MVTNQDKLLSYLEVKSAYQSQAVPKQNSFTFISNITGIPQAWTLDKAGKPVRYGKFSERVMSVHHAPSGDQTIVGVDEKGNEKQQLFLLKDADAATEPLMYKPEYFHYFGDWSPDGKRISFSSNRRHPGYFDVFIQNVDTKETEKVYSFDGNCKPLNWLPDGEHILISIDETNIENELYILNLTSGHTTKVGRQDVLATYSAAAFMKDEKNAYLLTNLNEETVYFGGFSLDHPAEIEKIFHIKDWDLEELKVSPDERWAAFTVNEGGKSRLILFDLDTREDIYVSGVPEGVIDSLSWRHSDQLIFTLKTPTMPGDVWSYTLSDGSIERMTNIGHAEVEELWVEPQLHSYRSFDGVEVPYFLYEKNNGTHKPAVIYVHGGPESQIRAEYNPVIQYMVDKGFAVATPNVRGSNGYGRSYIKLDDGRKRMDAVKDLAWLVEDLTAFHSVDSKKIGIMGRSYGGFMVLAATTHYPELWAAAVDIVGISHFTTFLQNTGPWRRHLRECEYGTLEHDTDFFEEIAPLNHSHKIEAPLLVFHGRNDTRVPVSEANQLVSDMQSRGQTVEFTVFEDEGHHTEKLENIVTMHSRTIHFFEQNLNS